MKIRDRIKKLFDLHNIEDLVVGGHCGCCGRWVLDKVFEKSWPWGLCQECIDVNENE
jgi:hypothetical protein